MSPTGLIYSDLYLAHRTGDHPECPSRLTSVMEHLKMRRLLEELRVYEPRSADVEQLMMIHRQDYVFRVQRMCEEGGGYLDPDTVVCPESFLAARAAVGVKCCQGCFSSPITTPPGMKAPAGRL